MLGIVPPIKATPVRYPLNPSTPGYPMPLMLSTGDHSNTAYRVSPESQPPGTPELVLHDFVTPKLDAPMRQCSTLTNVMDQWSNDGIVVANSIPYTDGLSQALSNYKIVNQPGLVPARSRIEEKQKPTDITMSTVLPVVANVQQRRTPNFKPIFTDQPTGFRLCRPPGSFIWPSMVNHTPMLPTNNPSMTRQDQTVELRGPKDGPGNISSRQVLGIPTLTSTVAHVKQANYSTRSMAESQVAAVMASMFGCMANMAPNLSVPTLPLMTSEIDSSVTVSTTANNLGHCSSPEGQSDAALSLSLSLLSPGSHHNKDAL
jgi:hypothetical protein